MAGFIVGLSFATKQVYIVIAVPALLYLLTRGKKPTIMFLLGLLVGDPLLFILFDRLNNGNSWLYCLKSPAISRLADILLNFWFLSNIWL